MTDRPGGGLSSDGTAARAAAESGVGKLWNLVWRRRGDTYRTIVVAVLIALGVRTFLYEPFNIPSGSMKPTLLIGDYLFVSKFSYGYSKHSFPWSFPPFEGRVLGAEPERGDVVVFKTPADNRTDYIKRVIGLPGDRIQVLQGRLYINEQEVPREFLGEGPESCGGGKVQAFRETLPGGRQHEIWECSDSASYDNTKVFTVPPDHFFMMGDNRDNSQDSRTPAVGFVPFENLIGRAEFLFFSHSDEGSFWEVHKWPDMIRWDRLLMGVR